MSAILLFNTFSIPRVHTSGMENKFKQFLSSNFIKLALRTVNKIFNSMPGYAMFHHWLPVCYTLVKLYLPGNGAKYSFTGLYWRD